MANAQRTSIYEANRHDAPAVAAASRPQARGTRCICAAGCCAASTCCVLNAAARRQCRSGAAGTRSRARQAHPHLSPHLPLFSLECGCCAAQGAWTSACAPAGATCCGCDCACAQPCGSTAFVWLLMLLLLRGELKRLRHQTQWPHLLPQGQHLDSEALAHLRLRHVQLDRACVPPLAA